MPSPKPRPPRSIHPRLVPTFMDEIKPILESREIEKANKVPGLVPARCDSEKVPTDILLHRYDAHRYEGYKSEHSTYRDLIEKMHALCKWIEPIRKTSQVREKNYQEKVMSSIETIERLICDLVGAHRGFLEDPLILRYYRASTMFQNDQFFANLGQAFKRRTAPHASSKKQEAQILAAFRDSGRSLEDFNTWKTQGLTQEESDKATATPEAQRKLLKRHGLNVQPSKGGRTQKI